MEGGEEIVWAIRRAGSRVVELWFPATTAMGERTNDLRDIQYCQVAGTPVIRLFFSKIKTNTWRDDLQQFVWKLDALVRDE